ncbi:MAG: hypothetical protein M3Z16_10055, partial [Pseudomonadota bacterium]|nr:hypothetical protein [Pseudomonadota bacterium]
MNFQDSYRLLPTIVGFTLSLGLLWLGAELVDISRTRARVIARQLRGCSVLLLAAGLWWPGHFLFPADAASTSLWVWFGQIVLHFALAGV